MAKNLTDSAAYAVDGGGNPTVPVVVPEGTDFRNNAANVVEALAQVLANRAAWLRGFVTALDAAAAKLAGATFTGQVIVNGPHILHTPADANTPALWVPLTANAAPNPSGNRWQLVLRFKTGGGQYCNVYSGSDGGTRGGFAIVFNAFWSSVATGGYPNGHWEQYDSAQKSIALIWRYGDVRVVGQPAGTADWEFWPSSSVNAYGSELHSQTLRCGIIYAQNNDDTQQNFGYRYHTPMNRTSPLGLSGFYGNVYLKADGSIVRGTGAGSGVGGERQRCRLSVPPYCSFKSIRVRHEQYSDNSPIPNGAPDSFKVWKRSGLGNWAQLGSTATAANVVGETTTTVHGGGATELVLDTVEYELEWLVTTTDVSASNNRIIAMEMDWTDPGPSNGVSS